MVTEATTFQPSTAPSKIADILRKIVARRRERLAEARASSDGSPFAGFPSSTAGISDLASRPLSSEDNAFLGALTARRPGRAIIAEVKMGSPRLGSLVGSFDPVIQARCYAENGAAALSVVVEPDFFFGSYEILTAAHEASGLPTIAKDFLVDDLQLVWAKQAGARAVLLIAALYEAEELRSYARKARALGLVPLIETHDRGDLAKLAGVPWELVGVNNRDLRTFEVHIEHSIELFPSLPCEALHVAESGLRSPADLERLEEAGFGAFLIGESLVTAEDPADKLRQLVGEVP